jgi:hypothetical protein
VRAERIGVFCKTEASPNARNHSIKLTGVSIYAAAQQRPNQLV